MADLAEFNLADDGKYLIWREFNLADDEKYFIGREFNLADCKVFLTINYFFDRFCNK